jgi:hypothetical protein
VESSRTRIARDHFACRSAEQTPHVSYLRFLRLARVLLGADHVIASQIVSTGWTTFQTVMISGWAMDASDQFVLPFDCFGIICVSDCAVVAFVLGANNFAVRDERLSPFRLGHAFYVVILFAQFLHAFESASVGRFADEAFVFARFAFFASEY